MSRHEDKEDYFRNHPNATPHNSCDVDAWERAHPGARGNWDFDGERMRYQDQ
jgi:hypothetical protein